MFYTTTSNAYLSLFYGSIVIIVVGSIFLLPKLSSLRTRRIVFASFIGVMLLIALIGSTTWSQVAGKYEMSSSQKQTLIGYLAGEPVTDLWWLHDLPDSAWHDSRIDWPKTLQDLMLPYTPETIELLDRDPRNGGWGQKDKIEVSYRLLKPVITMGRLSN